MKKRMMTLVSLGLVGAMVLPMAAFADDAAAADEGKVLNIEVWNNEFPNRMKDHLPGFEANDP